MTQTPDKTTASLISDVIVIGKSERCLEFFYHMYGKDVGTLHVYVKNEEGHESLLWRQTGNHGNQWLRALIKITINTFQVVSKSKLK